MSAGKKTLEERIADVIRLLASDKDGDVIAAACALKRVLASAGTDIHGLPTASRTWARTPRSRKRR